MLQLTLILFAATMFSNSSNSNTWLYEFLTGHHAPVSTFQFKHFVNCCCFSVSHSWWWWCCVSKSFFASFFTHFEVTLHLIFNLRLFSSLKNVRNLASCLKEANLTWISMPRQKQALLTARINITCYPKEKNPLYFRTFWVKAPLSFKRDKISLISMAIGFTPVLWRK